MKVSKVTLQKIAVTVLVLAAAASVHTLPGLKPPSASDKQPKSVQADTGYRAVLPANSPAVSLDAFPIATRIEWVPSADVAQFSRRDPSGASYGLPQSEAKTPVPALVGQRVQNPHSVSNA